MQNWRPILTTLAFATFTLLIAACSDAAPAAPSDVQLMPDTPVTTQVASKAPEAPKPTSMSPPSTRSTPVATPTVGPQVFTPPGTGNTPVTPGAALFFSVVDQQGQPVDVVEVVISVEHDDPFGFYDFGGTRRFEAGSGGLFPFAPTSTNFPATISFQVVAPAGGVSDTLVVSNFEYAQAIAATEADFVGVHQFDLSKTGQTTNLEFVH